MLCLNRIFIILGAMLLMIIFLLPVAAVAAPSAEEPYELTQADGTRFIAVTKGDEWNSHSETDKGFTIVKQSDGNWYYVTGFSGTVPIVSTVRADQPAPPDLAPGLVPGPRPAGESPRPMVEPASPARQVRPCSSRPISPRKQGTPQQSNLDSRH